MSRRCPEPQDPAKKYHSASKEQENGYASGGRTKARCLRADIRYASGWQRVVSSLVFPLTGADPAEKHNSGLPEQQKLYAYRALTYHLVALWRNMW